MKLNIYIIIIFITFFFKISSYASENYKIKISGNERISSETIILFSDININNKITPIILNQSIKKLYDTGYFENVKIEVVDKIIQIDVIENKIIQNIEFSGVKNKSIIEQLNKLVKKDEKHLII